MSVITDFKKTVSELWSLLVGLRITGKNFAQPQVTLHYPRQVLDKDNLATFRGHIELVGKPKDPAVPRCISCMLCASICPGQCITIKKAPKPKAPPAPKPENTPQGDLADKTLLAPERMPPPGEKKAEASKTPAGFHLSFETCSLCGLCVQNCPVDSLRFSTDIYQAGFTRAEFEYNLLARLAEQAQAAGKAEKAEKGGQE